MFKFAPNLTFAPSSADPRLLAPCREQIIGKAPSGDNSKRLNHFNLTILSTLLLPGIRRRPEARSKKGGVVAWKRNMIYWQAGIVIMCNRSPLQPQICALLHSFRHIGTKGDLIGNIAHTTCGQNYINLLNHGINQDPKIYVSICWSNIHVHFYICSTGHAFFHLP